MNRFVIIKVAQDQSEVGVLGFYLPMVSVGFLVTGGFLSSVILTLMVRGGETLNSVMTFTFAA